MANEKELLKKQLGFLQKSKNAAEKTTKIFQEEMRKFKSGEKFESAKNAFAAVKERISSIEAMISKVQLESGAVKSQKIPKAKMLANPKPAAKAKKKAKKIRK